MIPYQNFEIFASVLSYFIIKIICSFIEWKRLLMYKQSTLTSIPERNENEEDALVKKWVPKKKHEVLKAKYKCLKKLFQIYDASVIGILPEPYPNEYGDEETAKRRRKKRSHRTKTDACAGTAELSSGDVTLRSETNRSDKESISTACATTVIRDLKNDQCSCTSTQMDMSKSDKCATTCAPDSKDDLHYNGMSERDCEFTQTYEPHLPFLMINEKRKLSKFQCFIQRIFGITRERKNYAMPTAHVYAASDNNIHNYERRRKRGLRFRRLRRPKKIQSEITLRGCKSPVILSFVQSVQRNCLMDTTPRQCPILGCRMMTYGIINYNDHLNLCHFRDRKYVCHFCHEGFERECDKHMHENEHIGINRLATDLSTLSTARQSSKMASNTQTDPEMTKCDFHDEKLKKIVSFFDKILDTDHIVSEIQKNRCSDSNLQSKRSKTSSDTTGDNHSTDSSDKRTVSCVNFHQKLDKSKCASSANTEMTLKQPFEMPVSCHFCGENFNYRRQLSLHVDLEHKVHDKNSKFHSCAGIMNAEKRSHSPTDEFVSEDGKINVQSIDKSSSGRVASSRFTYDSYSEISRRKSEESLSCDPSTNIVYYTSMESVKKPSVINSLVNKVRSYKWEPGTKIIRV